MFGWLDKKVTKKKDVNERNFACYHRNPYNVDLFMVFDFWGLNMDS